MRPRGKIGGILFLGAGLFLAAHRLLAGSPLAAGQELPPGALAAPLRLRLRLSDDRGRGQPLLAIGTPSHGSLLFWLWDASGRARLGFEDAQLGPTFSPAFSAAAGQTHLVEIAWGALWPAAAAPSAGLSADLRDTLWVAVDGQRLFFRKQAFSLRTEHVVFGANVMGSALAEAFFRGSEAILEPGDPALIGRIGMPLADLLPRRTLLPGGYPGPLRLSLSFPVGVPGREEPLLVGGKPGGAGFVYVHYDDARHLRIGFDAWGLRGPCSAPIEYRPGADYVLRLSVGFLYPPAAPAPQAGDSAAALLPAALWAEWEGHPVLATVVSCPPVEPGQITLGANLIGWNLTDAAFRGLFTGIEPLDPGQIAAEVQRAVFTRLPPRRPAWQDFPGPVRLRVIFPQNWRPGTGDPLVVAGPVGAADILYVSYEDEGSVHFGLDHWGGASLTSASVKVAPGSEHELTVAMGALLPPAGAPLYRQDPALEAQRDLVRVDLDGRTVLQGRGPHYQALPAQITYGINLAGGSMSGTVFTGRILSVAAAPLAGMAGAK
jgi:hypothetical protein